MNAEEWRGWYGKARNKMPYQMQKEEIRELLYVDLPKNTMFSLGRVRTVLDIGAGDGRLADLFEDKIYAGMDSVTTDEDITLESSYDDIMDGSVDLGVISLVLITLPWDKAQDVIDLALQKCQWVLIYEEVGDSLEDVQIAEDKWHHPLLPYFKNHEYNLEYHRVSKVNKNWEIFLLRGINV